MPSRENLFRFNLFALINFIGYTRKSQDGLQDIRRLIRTGNPNTRANIPGSIVISCVEKLITKEGEKN